MSVETILKGLEAVGDKLERVSGDQLAMAQRLTSLEQRGAKAGGESGEYVVRGDAREAYTKAFDTDAFRSFKDGRAASTGKLELDISLKSVTSATAAPPSQRQPGIVTPVEQPLTLLDLIPSLPATSNVYEAPKFNASALSSSGYQEGEGAAKPEGSFSLAWSPFAIATIAQHVTVSRQLLDDYALLGATIDRVMRYKLRKKIEAEILAGDGATNHIKGLLTYNTPVTSTTAYGAADRIGEAAAAMEDEGYIPQAAVLRATEMFKIEAERGTTDEYVAGGWSRPAASNMWGSRIARSGAMPANTGLLLDLGWISLLDRQAPTVEISRDHSDNFTKNMVTILCEARVGLYVADAAAIREITLSE